jgi:hypothetical protein
MKRTLMGGGLLLLVGLVGVAMTVQEGGAARADQPTVTTYKGTNSGGGTVSFRISDDGKYVLDYEMTGLEGDTCGTIDYGGRAVAAGATPPAGSTPGAPANGMMFGAGGTPPAGPPPDGMLAGTPPAGFSPGSAPFGNGTPPSGTPPAGVSPNGSQQGTPNGNAPGAGSAISRPSKLLATSGRCTQARLTSYTSRDAEADSRSRSRLGICLRSHPAIHGADRGLTVTSL